MLRHELRHTAERMAVHVRFDGFVYTVCLGFVAACVNALGRCRVGHGHTQNFGWVAYNAFGPTNDWPACSLTDRENE